MLGPKASNGSEVSQTRFSVGLMLVKKRRMRRAISGASGKRIEVKKIVAGVETGGAAFSFDGTAAGVMEFPFAGVGRKEL